MLGEPLTHSRTALITGASAGLGAEFARQLAAQGINLVLVARREGRLSALGGELSAAHDIKVQVLVADLSDPAAPAALHAELVQRNITVDILINNAGSAGPSLLSDRNWAEHRAYVELMMTSVAALSHLLVPGMVERGYGRVLNVASVAGRLMRANDTTYGPAKAYLIALSEALASSVKDTGVNVMALCPGFTRTEFHSDPHMHALRDAIPEWLWYEADVVVREGLRALERGRVVYSSGLLYRLIEPFTQSVFTRFLLRGSIRR